MGRKKRGGASNDSAKGGQPRTTEPAPAEDAVVKEADVARTTEPAPTEDAGVKEADVARTTEPAPIEDAVVKAADVEVKENETEDAAAQDEVAQVEGCDGTPAESTKATSAAVAAVAAGNTSVAQSIAKIEASLFVASSAEVDQDVLFAADGENNPEVDRPVAADASIADDGDLVSKVMEIDLTQPTTRPLVPDSEYGLSDAQIQGMMQMDLTQPTTRPSVPDSEYGLADAQIQAIMQMDHTQQTACPFVDNSEHGLSGAQSQGLTSIDLTQQAALPIVPDSEYGLSDMQIEGLMLQYVLPGSDDMAAPSMKTTSDDEAAGTVTSAMSPDLALTHPPAAVPNDLAATQASLRSAAPAQPDEALSCLPDHPDDLVPTQLHIVHHVEETCPRPHDDLAVTRPPLRDHLIETQPLLLDDLAATQLPLVSHVAETHLALHDDLAVDRPPLRDRLVVTQPLLLDDLAATQLPLVDHVAETHTLLHEDLAVNRLFASDQLMETQPPLRDDLAATQLPLIDRLAEMLAAIPDDLAVTHPPLRDHLAETHPPLQCNLEAARPLAKFHDDPAVAAADVEAELAASLAAFSNSILRPQPQEPSKEWAAAGAAATAAGDESEDEYSPISKASVGRKPAPRRFYPPVEEWLPPDPDQFVSGDPFDFLAQSNDAEKAEKALETSADGDMPFMPNGPDGTVLLSSAAPSGAPSGFVDDDDGDMDTEHEHRGGSSTQEWDDLHQLAASTGQEEEDTEFEDPMQLEARVLQREAELRQMRADFDSRVRRSGELRSSLQAKGGSLRETPASLNAKIAKAREHLASGILAANRATFSGEDLLERSRRLSHARDQEISFLERKMQSTQQKHQRLNHAREPVSDAVAKEALKEKQKAFVALKADEGAQKQKISSLGGDLKNIIDFMMRVNIEAQGGPHPDLSESDFLPQDVQDHLHFSRYTHVLLRDLIVKYEFCMAECKEKEIASNAQPVPAAHEAEQVQNQAARGPPNGPPQQTERLDHSTGNQTTSVDAPTLPASESASASFSQESKLLRTRFSDEMRRVASALAEEEVPKAGRKVDRNTLVIHEILRAAAWGDEATLKELLPQSGRFLETWHTSGDDPGLLGWTPWHAAAAHGQAATLTILKECTVRQGGNHAKAQGQFTASGLPALGVGCLRGHVEVVRTLLAGRASVDARDLRGNGVLQLTAASGMANNSRSIQKLLIEAHCDPDARNGSGQRVDPGIFQEGFAAPPAPTAPTSVRSDQGVASSTDARSAQASHAKDANEESSQAAESVDASYHIIESVVGHEIQQEQGFLSSALAMLRVPVRDAVGFGGNERAKTTARLSKQETDWGVWSEWAVNYTHAGLRDALDVARPTASPMLAERNRQAVVLTSERLLFFNASVWSISIAVPVSEIIEVCISSHSKTVLVIRSSRRADIVIDIKARKRFLDELQAAMLQLVSQRSGTAHGNHTIPVINTADLVSILQDERQRSTGTLAYVETNVFLFLPFSPSSLLLSGAAPAFFGFLDLQKSAHAGAGGGQHWRWQPYFFILKSGLGAQRRLAWCRHPNDKEDAGHLLTDSIRSVQAMDSIQGEPCIVVDHMPVSRSTAVQSLTLRAKSSKNRDEWASCLQALCSGHRG